MDGDLFDNNFGGDQGGGFQGGDANLGGQPQGDNPAWNDFLEVVPQELHDKVKPLLQKWDSGVQGLVQKVHSQYEPWKQISAVSTPDDVQLALNVLNTLNTNPEFVYRSLKEYHKFDDGTPVENGSGGQGQTEPDQEYRDPRYDTLEQNFGKLAEFVVNDAKSKKEAEDDAALDRHLSELRQKFGDYDEDYVVSKMINQNMSGEEAVKSFQAMVSRLAGTGPKPLVLGGGSTIPGQNTDVRKMTPDDARNLAMQMLARDHAERHR